MTQHSETTTKPKLDFRFLLSGPWVGGFIFCIVFSIICGGLGQWQMNRREQAVEEVNKIVANYDREAQSLEDYEEYFYDYDEQQKWTPVEMTGEYLEEDTLLARNRPRAGQPGYEVLVPFRTTDGQTFLIDRGWLPTGQSASGPDTVPEAPEGELTITVRILSGEPTLEDRSAPDGQVASIDLVHINERLDYEIADAAYGLMATEDPEPEEAPAQMPPPERDEGPHLSYSLQWFMFGLMSFVVWGYLARQKAVQDREDKIYGETEDQGFMSATRLERAKPVKRRRDGSKTDEEIEDEMLGYQGTNTQTLQDARRRS